MIIKKNGLFWKRRKKMKSAILAISEKKEILKQIRKELAEKYEVITFNNLLDAIDMVRESDFDLILLDDALEGISVGEAKKKLTSIGKDFITVALVDEVNKETTKELEKNGIFAYLLKPIKIEDLDAIILPSLNGLELIKENKRLEEKLSILEEDTDIIGQSTKIKDVRNLIEKIADSDLPVLIVGETGTGKDIIAKEIHRKSDRNKGKYAQVSCALYPGELIERELFGYERGAFSALTIEVPPLRERKEDIPVLANYFLNKIVRILHKETPVISGEAMKFLMEYYYPGNIMELKNLIERMALLSKDKILDVEQLPLEIKTKSDIVENKTVVGVGPLKEILEQEIYSLEEVERVVIAIALQKTRWNKQETSKILGIGRTTLYEKIRKYGLDTK